MLIGVASRVARDSFGLNGKSNYPAYAGKAKGIRLTFKFSLANSHHPPYLYFTRSLSRASSPD